MQSEWPVCPPLLLLFANKTAAAIFLGKAVWVNYHVGVIVLTVLVTWAAAYGAVRVTLNRLP